AEAVLGAMSPTAGPVRPTLEILAERGLVRAVGAEWALTEAGAAEARRLAAERDGRPARRGLEGAEGPR
ncbi:MAG: hypothetical protein R3247_16610, partial [Rhodothermales bacterium]|nr:hypothetical protein [Rhodothermales bacterium]